VKTAMAAVVAAGLMAAACGGAPESSEEPKFGAKAQSISMPAGYGRERGSGEVCDSNWSGGVCYVPDNKEMVMNFRAGSCNDWWKARFVEVWYELEPLVNSIDDEWAMIGGQNGNSDFYWWCGTRGPAGLFGQVTMHSRMDLHNVTGRGTLAQYRHGQLHVYTDAVEAQPKWTAVSEDRRQRWARNLIRRLVAEQYGHGIGGGAPLMNGRATDWFAHSHAWTDGMVETMACYNEDSGTSDDCR
jgi:hypothetical protein